MILTISQKQAIPFTADKSSIHFLLVVYSCAIATTQNIPSYTLKGDTLVRVKAKHKIKLSLDRLRTMGTIHATHEPVSRSTIKSTNPRTNTYTQHTSGPTNK